MKYSTFVLLLCSFAGAQTGTLTINTTQWNGLTRTYEVYTPPMLQPHPAMVMVLHGTAVVSDPSLIPTNVYHNMGWDQLADANGFVVVAPLAPCKQTATKPATRYSCFWQSLGTEGYFPSPPDDSGFLAALAAQECAFYDCDPSRMFVMGFSSGGMMTQRMGIEHADLFAAIAPLSGPVWVGAAPDPMPQPSQPIAVLEMHGDADPTIPYCGGVYVGWGQKSVPIPSVDVDMAYWTQGTAAPLCAGGLPVGFGFGRTAIQFVREIGFVHQWKQGSIAQVWEFFATHGR